MLGAGQLSNLNDKMKPKILTRFLAFFIDYIVIIVYAGFLFGIVTLIYSITGETYSNQSPIKGQLIGFLTLTIPVILYFNLMESHKGQATIGKYVFKLKVTNEQFGKPNFKRLLLRNALKFTPWELAHFGVHWILYFSGQDIQPPFWVWLALIFPQIIIVIFTLQICLNKENRSTYEVLSKTRVVKNAHS